MTKKTATPDELAKVWGELNAYRVLLFDLYSKALRDPDQPDEVTAIKQRSYQAVSEVEFPPEDEDTRSAAKVALDYFWRDFEDALKKANE